jgi:phosphohistidine swiveling domain-containing protein
VPFRSLDDLTPADEELVGGKAWNCARLKQRGFPVPDGLVIPAGASEADIAALDSDPWFDRWPPTERFAVRSSGLGEDAPEQSFAGINETRLNVARADVRDAVALCRASANSDRARAYRQARALPSSASAAGVLIQRMIQPVAAGVAFTIDPLTGASDEIVINSAFGLGAALVDGLVNPDEIRVRKDDGHLMSYRIGDVSDQPQGRSLHETAVGDGLQTVPTHRPLPQTLSPIATTDRDRATLAAPQIERLWSLLVAIEREYGSPQDIEWCDDVAQIWIVQSRPITIVPVTAADTEWTRANLAEVLPEITSPQALDVVERLLNIAERRYMGRLIAPYSELGPMVKAFYGRLYFNLTQLRRVCRITGMPPAAMLRSLGHSGHISPEDEQAPRPAIREALPCLPDLLRTLWRHLTASRVFRAHQARVADVLAEFAALDGQPLSDAHIWDMLVDYERRSPESMEAVLLFGGVLLHEQGLRKICDAVGFPFERLLYSHLASGERSVSAQQAFDLVALADAARSEPRVAQWLARPDVRFTELRTALVGTSFLAAFNQFLEQYGHRGLYETDWALPRYSEDPTPLLEAIRMHLRDGRDDRDEGAMAARTDAEAAATRADFERRFTGIRRVTLLPIARRLLRTIKRYYVWREQCRSDMIRVMSGARRWHLIVAQRFVERSWLDRADDYFLLRVDEIGSVLQDVSRASGLRDVVAARASDLERYRRVEMPMLMRESELPRLLRASGVTDRPDATGELRGVPVSRGSVEGEVVVITDPADFARMKRGAILVTRATDPSWTPLFTLAAGVIVELGGVLSHASTIAREYGIPALANVRHATRRLKTGDRALLNATEGFVRILP